MSSLNIKGLEELNRSLKKLKDNTEKETDKILVKISNDLATKSSASAPVLTTALRQDLKVPKKIPNGYEIGSKLPYTRIQHETLWFNHPRGGGAKFLEYPFNQNKDSYMKAIEEVIKNVNK